MANSSTMQPRENATTKVLRRQTSMESDERKIVDRIAEHVGMYRREKEVSI